MKSNVNIIFEVNHPLIVTFGVVSIRLQYSTSTVLLIRVRTHVHTHSLTINTNGFVVHEDFPLTQNRMIDRPESKREITRSFFYRSSDL